MHREIQIQLGMERLVTTSRTSFRLIRHFLDMPRWTNRLMVLLMAQVEMVGLLVSV